MLRNELKAALAILGTVCVPMFAQTDQSMSDSRGQQQQQPGYVSGDAIKAGQLPGGYNQSAAIMCDDGWDVFVSADYIWWNWSQDRGMNLGFAGLGAFTSADVSLHPNTTNPGYASGFQVGLGFVMKGMDDWNFYGEYTWYKNSASNSNAVAGTLPNALLTANLTGSSDISIAYNNADFLLQRSFYFGKKLTSNFYTGLRALWINNDASLTASGTLTALSSIVTGDYSNVYMSASNSSWALGPKFGFDANWLLGYGVKFLSNMSASVLYTRYTGDFSSSTTGTGKVITAFSGNSSVSINESNFGRLRPVLESYLGLGWGSYFGDNSFRLDLSIGYDFNVHFDYVTNMTTPGGSGPSNLYLHGLNVQARFDF
jgi:hypothetical protein